ncbi:hypothetical protein F5884DRAFT_364817 [Xylogone sp. PMI_703]|nr:hypothetical protein F5884DRAFT_364817 [Xylogone sp. PMI_703]
MAQQHNTSNRNSPHLNHLQNGSAPNSPSMSTSQQQGGQSRQPVSYPSPTSYPSPSLQNAQYNYPPPNNQQVSEPYRASPTGSNGSMSLPSMRSLDPLQQQQQAQQHHMGSPLPPPVAQMGGPYYTPQGQPIPYPSVTSDPTGQMRYALPVTADSRVMSGGRHKKEIKRRTKTGCLTCRKRRIKCDEQHPACRNCQKSKRECLGYDPIFKPQPGPAAIQPAPSSAPPQAPIVATANPYGNQPQMLQSGYGAPVTNMGYVEPALSAGVSSPGSATQAYEFASAIDPALEAAAPAPTTASSTPLQAATTPAKRSITELLALGGPAPPPLPANSDVTQSPATIDEAKHLFYSIYAPGLENFLETKWFQIKGVSKLLSDKSLLEQFAQLLEQFAKTQNVDPRQIDPRQLAYAATVEARVVWALACMVRQSAAETNGVKAEGTPAIPAADDAIEAGHRLTVFENLLTNSVAESNPLTKPIPNAEYHKSRELEFWYTLGNFVAIKEDDPQAAKQMDETLAILRNLLDGRENRDVLYSIAVVRAIGPRVTEYAPGEQPVHFDESDNRSKVIVAKKFVQDEAQGAGTTNVIRRMCELAARSWLPAATSAPVPQAK